MGKWEDRVANHPVNGMFTNALAAIDAVSEERRVQAPEDLDRLGWALEHVRQRVTRAPAVAVTQTALDQVQQLVTNLHSEVNSYSGSGSLHHLANANSHADSMLQVIHFLPPLSLDATADAVAAEVDRVRGLVGDVVAATAQEMTHFQESTENIKRDTRQSRDAFVAQAKDAQEQMTALHAQAQSLTQRLEDALATQQTQFEEAEAARAETAEAGAKATLAELEGLKVDAEQVVGAIGVAGVAKGYSDTAEIEREVANKWRFATVGVAALAAVVLGWALFTVTGETSWQRLVIRLVVSVSFAGLAAYCGRQSEQHRKVERDARSRHLQLAALNAYLANLPEDKVVELKAHLAPGYFTPTTADEGDRADKNGETPLSPAQLVELVKMLASKGTSS